MAYGQGAAASLPICAGFLKKVYADTSLGYSQDEQFDMPAGFDPCGSSVEEQVTEEIDESVGLDNLFN